MQFNTDNLLSLRKMTAELNAGKLCFNIEKNGQWNFTKNPKSLVDMLRLRKSVNIEKLPSEFCKKYLYPLEQKAVLFGPEPIVKPGEGWLRKSLSYFINKKMNSADTLVAKQQNRYFEAISNASEAIENAILRLKMDAGQDLLLPMAAEMTSLKYRIEKENGGYDALELKNTSIDTAFIGLAKTWKSKQKNYLPADRKLNLRDYKHLLEISRYPHVVNLLRQYTSLRETYFKWSIRDNGSEKPFIEYLNFWHTKLDPNFINSRVSYYGSELLSIIKKTKQKFSGRKKILTLPIEVLSNEKKLEVKNKNILNGSKVVTLNKKWKLTIDEIFSIFGNKNLDTGNLEFFGKGGIKNWNCQKMGYWNPKKQIHELIDLRAPKWWEQLPSLEPVEPITVHELQRRYRGLKGLTKDDWVVIVRSSRKYTTLDIRDTHGFIEIAIPQNDGTFRLYDFGKLAAVFPDGTWELLKFLANTVKSKIYYPDENIYYNFRQHAAWAKRLWNRMEKDNLMNLMQDLLIRARDGNLEFAFGNSNCGFAVQELMDKLLGAKNTPNFFKVSLFDLSMPPPLQTIFTLIRFLPCFLQSAFVKAVEVTFGGWRGIEIVEKGKKVFKSVHRSAFSKTMVNYLPAYLPHQILNKKIEGSVWFGIQ